MPDTPDPSDSSTTIGVGIPEDTFTRATGIINDITNMPIYANTGTNYEGLMLVLFTALFMIGYVSLLLIVRHRRKHANRGLEG